MTSSFHAGYHKRVPNVGNVFERGASFSETAQASIIVNECSSTRWRRRSIFEATFDSHIGHVSDVSTTSPTSNPLWNQFIGRNEGVKKFVVVPYSLLCEDRDRETGFLLCISRTCRRQLFFVANCFEQTGQVDPITVTVSLQLDSNVSIDKPESGSVFTSGIISIGRSISINGDEFSLGNGFDWITGELFCH